jgi:hypothetical protein
MSYFSSPLILRRLLLFCTPGSVANVYPGYDNACAAAIWCHTLICCSHSALFLLLQLCNHAEVFERGGVAFDFAVGGEFTEQAAHDFSAAGFGE